MAPGSRLEELTARYMQNPRRYFVPLANEYRIAHELDRAIALCREHLPSQPGHMSGHIVLGRAYFDKGDLLAAREVFATSVALDDENLIALRHLGDIARTQHDSAEAHRWYSRVLAADPQNAEIEAILHAMDATDTASAAPTHIFTSDAALDDVTPPGLRAIVSASFDETALDLRAKPFGTLPPLESAPLQTFDLATLIGADTEIDTAETPLAAGSTPSQRTHDELPVLTDTGLEHFVPRDMSGDAVGVGFSFDDLDTMADLPPLEVPTTEAHAATHIQWVASEGPESSSDGSGVPVAPGAALSPVDDELLSHPGFSALASFASWRTAQARDTPSSLPAQAAPLLPAPNATPRVARAISALAADENASWNDDEPTNAGVSTPEFMTETMAVLYEQQGYVKQALDIYTVLQRLSPNDEVIARKIADLRRIVAQAESQASLQEDAANALQYEDLSDVGSFDSSPVRVSFANVPVVPDQSLDEAFASAWSEEPPEAELAGDDWFANDDANADERSVDIFTESHDMFGVTLGRYVEPAASSEFDGAVADASAAPPAISLAAIFGNPDVSASDGTVADFLSVLAGQMVGRLSKEAPTLPVPDVLDLPPSAAANSASGAALAPLLSFDRFFSGSGSAPRIRVDTPLATGRLAGAPPAVPHAAPSLSPTFGGMPVVTPPSDAMSGAWTGFDRFVPAAVKESATGSDGMQPVSAAPSAPDMRGNQSHALPLAPPPRGDDRRAASTHEGPAAGPPHEHAADADLAAQPTDSKPAEPPQAPSSDFHRWLEGLS